MPVLLEAYRTHSSLVNPGVIGPTLVRFLHDVRESSSLLTRPSALQYANPFLNASTANEGGYRMVWQFLAIWPLKLVIVAMSPKQSHMIAGLFSPPIHLPILKIDEDRSSIF